MPSFSCADVKCFISLGRSQGFCSCVQEKKKTLQCLLQISNLIFHFSKILRFCGLANMKILGVNKRVGGSKSRPKFVKKAHQLFPSFKIKKDIKLKTRSQAEVTSTCSVTNLTNVFKHRLKVQRLIAGKSKGLM